MDDLKKKKTLTELAVGGGLFVVFLPLILFAIFWALVAIGLGLLFAFVYSRDPLAVYRPMLLVYGALLAVLIYVAVQFMKRFAFLMHRWRSIRKEQRRMRTLGMSPTQPSLREAESAEYTSHDEGFGEALRKSR